MASLTRDSPAPFLTQIMSVVSVKLDIFTYLMWKSQLTIALRGHNLLGYIDGSLKSPPPFLLDPSGNPTDISNPQYDEWQRTDSNVLSCILATLSNSVLSHVVGLSSAREVWLALE